MMYGYPYQPYSPAVPDMLAQYRGQQMQAPVQPQPQPQQNGGAGLIWVQGEAGAKSYLVAPGHTLMLMDSEAQVFYIKSADASGMPLPLRIFDYSERRAPAEARAESASGFDPERFVTREEFEKKLAALMPTAKTEEGVEYGE